MVRRYNFAANSAHPHAISMMAAYSGKRFPRKIGKNASPISRAAALRCSFCCRMISNKLSDPSRKCSRSPVQMTHSSQLSTSTVQSKRQTPRSKGGRHRSNLDRSLSFTVSMKFLRFGPYQDLFVHMFTQKVSKRCTGRSHHINEPYRKDIGKTRCGPTFLARANRRAPPPLVANQRRSATLRSGFQRL
jgi:hypothetical protein